MKIEWKVITTLLGLILVVEFGVRVFEVQLSKDLSHLHELPEAAKRLSEADAYKVLIVGNSLARHGIDRQLLTQRLEAKMHKNVCVEAFYPDATGITEWNYGLRRYFLNQGVMPDRLILVTGQTHLYDSFASPERLGAFYVDDSDLQEALRRDLKLIESKARFFLARISSLFANRARIQPYVFYNFLPEYTQTIQDINEQRKKPLDAVTRERREQMSNLSRLLALAQVKGVAVTVVAIPMLVPYYLPDKLQVEIKKQRASFLDLSDIDGIEEDNFFDGYHLDVKGGRRVTIELSEIVAGGMK